MRGFRIVFGVTGYYLVNQGGQIVEFVFRAWSTDPPLHRFYLASRN